MGTHPTKRHTVFTFRGCVPGRTVRVEYFGAVRGGRILGVVYRDETDINLQMVATGNARHAYDFENTPAYSAAEAATKAERLGLWAL